MLFHPQMGNKLSQSNISIISNSDGALLTHLASLIWAISSHTGKYTAKFAVAATLGETCKAVSAVVYLQAVDKANMPGIAPGFEGVFLNCTGTSCHREH